MPRVSNPSRRRTFIREWRQHRGLTQQQLADRLDVAKGNVSKLEAGKQGYTQDLLEAIAAALRTDVASLIMRNPSDPEAIWSIWDQAKPGDRKMIVDLAKTVTKRASG